MNLNSGILSSNSSVKSFSHWSFNRMNLVPLELWRLNYLLVASEVPKLKFPNVLELARSHSFVAKSTPGYQFEKAFL